MVSSGATRDRRSAASAGTPRLSFHETKNFVSGEGGALLINRPTTSTGRGSLYDKGTNRRAFMLGEVDKYSWKDTGSSFGMSDLTAAYLWATGATPSNPGKARRVYRRYEEELAPHASRLGFTIPAIPEGSESAWHMFYLLLPDADTRGRVLRP